MDYKWIRTRVLHNRCPATKTLWQKNTLKCIHESKGGNRHWEDIKMRVLINISVYVYVCVCKYVRVCVCACVRVCVCVCVRVCFPIHTYLETCFIHPLLKSIFCNVWCVWYVNSFDLIEGINFLLFQIPPLTIAKNNERPFQNKLALILNT